jgi:5'-methylthioadenosine phosphorylase
LTNNLLNFKFYNLNTLYIYIIKDRRKTLVKIGIIGGSGLDNPDILKDAEDINVETAYGRPSSPLKKGKIHDVDVVLIARHGREHTIPPTQVNFRANIQALKDQGCSHILATTACGSLREKIDRGDLVILDQFIDFTRLRKISFFEEFAPGDMKHTPMADPFSEELRRILIETARELNLKYHETGTVVTIEGPRFSTRAESNMFRIWGADVINMSIAPETILANEANIPYAAVAMSTDYDCWKEDEVPVTWEEILEIFGKNVDNVIALLTNTIKKMK